LIDILQIDSAAATEFLLPEAEILGDLPSHYETTRVADL